MNSTKLGLSLTSSVLASVLASSVYLVPLEAYAAPPEGGTPGPDASADAAPEGDAPEGDAPEGGTPEDAEPAEGEETEGEPAEGEETEGEPEEGEETEGEPEEEPVPEEEAEPEEDLEAEPEEEEEEEAEAEPELEGPQRPQEPVWGRKGQHKMDGKGMLIAGGVVTGLGAAFIVTSVLITACDFESNLACRYGDQRDFLIPTAVASTGLGLLFLGVGVANHFKYKKWENWSPEKVAVVPTWNANGGGVSISGRF